LQLSEENGLADKQSQNTPEFRALWELRADLSSELIDPALQQVVLQMTRGAETPDDKAEEINFYFSRSVRRGLYYMSSDWSVDNRIFENVFKKYRIRIPKDNTPIDIERIPFK
jgi:hypothetical protein